MYCNLVWVTVSITAYFEGTYSVDAFCFSVTLTGHRQSFRLHPYFFFFPSLLFFLLPGTCWKTDETKIYSSRFPLRITWFLSDNVNIPFVCLFCLAEIFSGHLYAYACSVFKGLECKITSFTVKCYLLVVQNNIYHVLNVWAWIIVFYLLHMVFHFIFIS